MIGMREFGQQTEKKLGIVTERSKIYILKY